MTMDEWFILLRKEGAIVDGVLTRDIWFEATDGSERKIVEETPDNGPSDPWQTSGPWSVNK
jgi:hypothetical protein